MTEPTLKERYDSLQSQIDDAEAYLKDLLRKRNALLEESMKAAEDSKIMRDSMADMLNIDPDADIFGRPKRKKTDLLNWDVKQILWATEESSVYSKPNYGTDDHGVWVSVRLAGKEAPQKTFLGIYIGDFARSMSCQLDPELGTLRIEPSFKNPMIFVPELKQIVFGSESWWGQIESPEDLKEITDETIGNVWYVQAAKEMLGVTPNLPEEDEPGPVESQNATADA